AVMMIGFGRPVNERGLFLEGDAFMTIDKGDVNSLDGSGSYSVNGLGVYGGWRSNGFVSLLVKAGFAYTEVNGPENATASDAGFGPVAGIGVGFGRHLVFELRVLNDHVNTLNASWRF
ncbi:MAG TPA: hypothetical protein VF267_06140, partial [Gammaproteobacteria bacterium]